MAYWLFKQEPSCYSFADLERDGETTWDGVANPLALKYLRMAQAGDRVLFYETGKVKAAVGEMKVLEPGDTPRVQVVQPLPRPVTLKEVKAEPALADWDLVRNSRLSVMPVTAGQWRKVMELSRRKE
jgi:predicted RNA-binding protein with PUA-like domain